MKFGNNLGSGIGVEMQAFLDKTLLTNIVDNTVWDRFATISKPLPLKNSKEILFEKWIRMIDLYQQGNNVNEDFTGNDITVGEETLQNIKENEYQNFILPEGSSGTSKMNMQLIQTSTSVFPIGDFLGYTEEMEMFHHRWTVAEAARQYGEAAALIIDGYYRDLYINGAGHFTDLTGTDAAEPAITEACRKMETALRLSGAKPVNRILSASPNYGTVPVRAEFTMLVHTAAANALEDNPDFVPVEQYTQSPMEGERGIIGRIRVIENSNAVITPTGTANTYTAKAIVLGNEHTAHVPVRGKGSVEFIYQALGSAGTADPLKRVGTVGFKGWLGGKTLYPERLGRIDFDFTW
jgi:N4-gp56 family major capsid protein